MQLSCSESSQFEYIPIERTATFNTKFEQFGSISRVTQPHKKSLLGQFQYPFRFQQPEFLSSQICQRYLKKSRKSTRELWYLITGTRPANLGHATYALIPASFSCPLQISKANMQPLWSSRPLKSDMPSAGTTSTWYSDFSCKQEEFKQREFLHGQSIAASESRRLQKGFASFQAFLSSVFQE